MQSQMLVIGLLSGLAGAPLAWAAAGDVDPGFDYRRPMQPDPDPTTAVALPDGYLVIRSAPSATSPTQQVSRLEVTKIDPDGRILAEFGINGTTSSVVSGSTQLAGAVSRQSNGSILLGGHRLQGDDSATQQVAAVARLDTEGALDPAFGTAGIATLDVPGDLDRVAGVAEMRDGRIAVLVWSRLEEIPWECDYHDRATLVVLDANGHAASEVAFTERNGYAVSSCRTVLTLQALPDGTLLYGSEVGVSDGMQFLTGLNFRYGPFVMDPALGLVVGEVQGSAINMPFPTDHGSAWAYWRDVGWAAGFRGPVTWQKVAVDAGRGVIYVGFSNDDGQAGVARFRLDGQIDTGWSQDGIAVIEESGRYVDNCGCEPFPDIPQWDHGLAADIRMIDIQADGSIVVATEDGFIERLSGGSDPAHGAFVHASVEVVVETVQLPLQVLREGGSVGAVSVEYEVAACVETPQVDCPVTNSLQPAEAGRDFEVASGRLDWADGDSTTRTITVRTLPDSVAEVREYFQVWFRNPSGGASIISAPVTIYIESNAAPGGPPDAGDRSGGGGTTDGGLLLALALAALLRLGRGSRGISTRIAR